MAYFEHWILPEAQAFSIGTGPREHLAQNDVEGSMVILVDIGSETAETVHEIDKLLQQRFVRIFDGGKTTGLCIQ